MLALLARKPADKPWFAQVSFPGPHPPFVATGAMLNRTAASEFPLAMNNSVLPAASQEGVRRAYAAELEHLDTLFALLLAAIEGERDNTIVIVMSDHGEMLGDLQDWGKTMPWQGSASVPLIVVGPAFGVPAAAAIAAPVATLDVVGTILDFAAVPAAANMTTRSLRAYLGGGASAPPPRAVVSSGLANYRAVLEVPPANASAIFKLVCCRGACPGGDGSPFIGGDASDYPGLLVAEDRAAASAGQQHLRTFEGELARLRSGAEAAANIVKLFDIVSDPFDLHDISGDKPGAIARMSQFLPSGWCH